MVLLSFFSCNDYLDVKPKNFISLETMAEVKSLMSSYFYGITNTNSSWRTDAVTLDGKPVFFPYNTYVTTNFMFYADNIVMKHMPNLFYVWRYYENSYYQATEWMGYDVSTLLWNEYYQNIGYFNLVLDALEKIEDKSTEEYKEVYCETKMLRTLMYFNLLKFFAPYDNDKYGLPLTTDSEATEGTARSTQTEIYKFLLDELNAIEVLDFNPTAWNVFYSKKKLAALYAQIYWFKAESAAKESEDWQYAAEYAKKVLEGKTLVNTAGNLKDIFKSKSRGFELNNPYCLLIVSNGRAVVSNFFAPWGFAGDIPLDTEFASLYDVHDIRIDAYFNDNMQVFKWSPSYSARNVVPLWRIAEFQLIIAEAYARMGENANAVSYLNAFKQSRIPGYPGYQGSDLLDEIIKERRKEFCFEFGSRWIDLKRMNKGFSRIAISADIPSTENREVEFTLQDGDYRFALPIPLSSELSVNNKLEQNPGWITK